MQTLVSRAYGEIQQRTAGDKEIERAVFTQITEALEDVAHQDAVSPTDWVDAIHRNQQLWTILATDLLSSANALPDATKTQLFQISQFVRKHSLQVLSGAGDVADLIEVNKSIIVALDGRSPSPSNSEIVR